MKGELRRLIGAKGLEDADAAVAGMLTPSTPVPIVPLPAHMAATGAFKVRSAYDASRQVRDEGALKDLAPMVKSVYQTVRADAVSFVAQYAGQLQANARDTLAASEARAASEQARYGLSSEEQVTRPARRVLDEKVWVDKPAETKTVYHLADANSPAVKNLQAAAGVLLARRRDLEDRQLKFGTRRAASCNQGFCPPLSKADLDEQQTLKDDRGKYDNLRDALTFQYPILDRAADWDRGSIGQLNEIASSKSAQDLADTLGARLAGNLADIKRTREGLANGAINIWRLKPLTDLASRQFQLQTASNPARKRLVDDKLAAEQPHMADAILEGLALVILNVAAIALSPVTGGVSLAVAGAVNVGLAAKHTIDYLYEDALAGSDLRRHRRSPPQIRRCSGWRWRSSGRRWTWAQRWRR